MARYKTLSSQLGKSINHIGAHIPHAVVGIIRKRRSKSHGFSQNLKGGSKVKPIKEYDPFPMDFLPGSM